jgi:hypothetical protein
VCFATTFLGSSDVCSSGPEEGQVARAKVLTDDLLEVVRGEYAKVKAVMHQQQMELHQAQMQYASYGVMPVGYPPSIRIINGPFRRF